MGAAYQCMQRQDWLGASKKLEQCRREKLDPKFVLINLALCYSKLKQFKNAETVLLDAERTLKGSSDVRAIFLNQIYLYSCEGELDALQNARRKFVTRFPKDKDAKKIRDELEYYDKEFRHDKTLKQTQELVGLPGWLPWYSLTQMPKMPIRVYIHAAPDIAAGTKIYTGAVNKQYGVLMQTALMAWASAADHKLSFQFVSTAKDAQLICDWTTDTSHRVNSFADGQSHWEMNNTQGTVRTSAHVFLEKNKAMSNARFFEVALHEVGHALGLGHSQKPTDVMYYMGAVSEGHLSNNDVLRIRGLYSEPFYGRELAEQYVTCAFINGDYEAAYKLLADDASAKITLDQFREKTRTEKLKGTFSSLTVTHFERGLNTQVMHYGLIVESNKQKVRWHISVVGDEPSKYKIEQANVLSVDELKVPQVQQ